MYVHLSIDIQSVKVILNLKKKLNLNIFLKGSFFKYKGLPDFKDPALSKTCPETRIRFRTPSPRQMVVKVNTTREQSNKKSLKVGDHRMEEMEE